jgi:rubrerythrin
MPVKFNADEVFAMAEKIEQNGAAFYRKAAGMFKDEGTLDFLTRLAEMEDEHKRIFEQMRNTLEPTDKAETAYDPYDEAALYLEEMADTHGGEGSPDVAASLTGNESKEDILQTAMGLEKKSILFYIGIKGLVPEKMGQEKIDRIIDEERSHVATLAREIKKVRQGG